MQLKKDISLPDTSCMKGLKIWFVYKDNDNILRGSGSAFSGKETVFMNDTLVSERRSYAHKSDHSFTFGEDRYEVKFHMINMFTGKLKCSFFKNGILLKSILMHQAKLKLAQPLFTFKKVLWSILFVILMVGAITYQIFSLPVMIYFTLVGAFFFFFKLPKARFEFQELD